MTFALHSALVSALCLPGALPLAATQPPAAPPAVTATTLLRTTTTWDGAPIAFPKAWSPEIRSVVVTIPQGAATEWHKHPVNNIAYLLEGEIRLELEDGRTRAFRAGEAFAEVVDTWHRGVNTGQGPVRILVVYAGEVGRPLSVPRPPRAGE